MDRDPRRLVFVAGAARSGTTLLGEMLGAQPGVLDVGEFSLFWRDAARGNTCGCGEPLTRCPVWGEALDRLREELDLQPTEYAGLSATRFALAHTTRPGRLRALAADPAAATPAEARLLRAGEALLRIALDLTGSTVAVDTSKTLAARRFVAVSPGWPTRSVHLVRDARAVTASTVRSRAVARGNAESLPPGAALPVAVGRWVWGNALSVVGRPDVRLRYERLVEDTATVLPDLCRDLGLDHDPATVVDATLVSPRPNHAAVGNPRRGAARTPLRVDERWREELSPVQQRTVRAVTAPVDVLLRTRGGL